MWRPGRRMTFVVLVLGRGAPAARLLVRLLVLRGVGLELLVEKDDDLLSLECARLWARAVNQLLGRNRGHSMRLSVGYWAFLAVGRVRCAGIQHRVFVECIV